MQVYLQLPEQVYLQLPEQVHLQLPEQTCLPPATKFSTLPALLIWLTPVTSSLRYLSAVIFHALNTLYAHLYCFGPSTRPATLEYMSTPYAYFGWSSGPQIMTSVVFCYAGRPNGSQRLSLVPVGWVAQLSCLHALYVAKQLTVSAQTLLQQGACFNTQLNSLHVCCTCICKNSYCTSNL